MYCYELLAVTGDGVLKTGVCPYWLRQNEAVCCTLMRVCDDVLLMDRRKVCGINNGICDYE